jgi:hypothetical protein
MATRRQCFVEFLSPGTFYDETTEKPIEQWDIKGAVRMAADITERYGSRPYGFVFKTKLIADDIDDGEGGKMAVAPKTVEASGTHFLNGEVKRFDDIPDTRENSILRSNMRGNRWPLMCETANGYRHVGVFGEGDKVVDSTGRILHDGNSEHLKTYRAERIAQWEADAGGSRE